CVRGDYTSNLFFNRLDVW
nr:immunoglobulin heavy chain junction region [Macaca mulatta]